MTHRQYLSILALFLALLLLGYFITIQAFSRYPESGDFSKFYQSGKFFLEGKDIYTPIPVGSLQPRPQGFKSPMDSLHPNLNPPFQTLLMLPLSLFDYLTAYWLWSIFSLACGLLGVTLLVRAYAGVRYDSKLMLGSWILLLAYFPTYVTVVYGQFSLVLFLCLVVAWIASKKENDRVAGMILGAAMGLKIFTGLFMIFFAVRRRWRLLGWMLMAFLFCSLFGLLIFGESTYINYYKILANVTWYAASWNASFMGFFSRIFGGSDNIPFWTLPWLAKGLADLCSLLLIFGLIYVACPRPHETSQIRYDLGFSLTIVAMLLISPLGWMYYFPCLFIPLAVVERNSTKTSSKHVYRILIVFALLLSTIPQMLIPSTDINEPLLWFVWAGFYFYSLLLFSGILIYLSRSLT